MNCRKVFCWQQVDYNRCNISFDVRDGGLKRPQRSASKIRTYNGGSCSEERVSIPGFALPEEALGCSPHVLQAIRCASATGSPRKRTRWLSGARRTHNRVAGCPKRYLWDKGNYITIIEAEAERFGYDKRFDGELQSPPAPRPMLEIWVQRPVPPLAKYLIICILSPRTGSSTLCSLIQRTRPLITWAFKSAYFLPCPKEILSINFATSFQGPPCSRTARAPTSSNQRPQYCWLLHLCEFKSCFLSSCSTFKQPQYDGFCRKKIILPEGVKWQTTYTRSQIAMSSFSSFHPSSDDAWTGEFYSCQMAE